MTRAFVNPFTAAADDVQWKTRSYAPFFHERHLQELPRIQLCTLLRCFDFVFRSHYESAKVYQNANLIVIEFNLFETCRSRIRDFKLPIQLQHVSNELSSLFVSYVRYPF